MTGMIEIEIPSVTENRKILLFLRKAPLSGMAVGWSELLEGGVFLLLHVMVASSAFRGPLV